MFTKTIDNDALTAVTGGMDPIVIPMPTMPAMPGVPFPAMPTMPAMPTVPMPGIPTAATPTADPTATPEPTAPTITAEDRSWF